MTDQGDILNVEQEQELKSLKVIEKEIFLKHSAEELWPFITNADVLERQEGFSSIKYSFEKRKKGHSSVFGEFSSLGVQFRYEEEPYEWVPYHYYSLDRSFEKGLFIQVNGKTTLENQKGGGCLVKIKISYIARYSWISPSFIIQQSLKKLTSAVHQLDGKLIEYRQRHFPFSGYLNTTETSLNNANDLYQEWRSLMPGSPIPKKIADFIFDAPDPYVSKMRPYELAEYYQQPKLEVLTFCLLATKEGFLHLTWDILCPNCHGVNSRNYHLESVQSPSHCSACNIDYTVEFDQHVEVRFHPDEKIRTLDEEDRCPLNPAFNSHVWSQINVESKETKEVKIQFEAGRYRIHSLDLDGDLIFDVSDKGKTKTSLSFDQDKFLSINEKEIFLDTLFYFENNTGTKKTFRIEKLNQFQYAATASEVTTLQDFRDLFGSEVLQPNVQLGVSNLCFLFSDLKDSTKLYEAVGDATAFSIIQNHFAIMIKIIREFQGGVVKTIGDAVMAVFSDPVLAFQASQKILEVFEKRNIERPNEEKIILKLGLHRGPCIVINFNECIDYFGSTVNKSARIEAESNGGELIFSEEIMKDVRHLLKLYDQKQHVKPFYKRLKGIQKEQKLYRLVMNEFKL